MPTRQLNYGYGRGMGGRGYGGFGGSGLIAGQRAMWGTPVNYGLMFGIGYQTTTAQDKAKTAELKLELAQREKNVADTIKQHNEFKTKGDKLQLTQGDNESLTKSLQTWKNEAYIIRNKIMNSKDPAEKAQLEADYAAIENKIENAIGSYGYWDGEMKIYADDIVSDNFVGSTDEEVRNKLTVYMNPELSTREWKDGEFWITPKDGSYDPITGGDLKKLLPKGKSMQAGDGLNTFIDAVLKKKTTTGVDTSVDTINRAIRSAFAVGKQNCPECSKSDIAKSLMYDNDFIDQAGVTIGYNETKRHNDIQKMWEGMKGENAGEWVNATPEDMVKLKEKWDAAHPGEELETLDKEFTNWVRTGVMASQNEDKTFATAQQNEIDIQNRNIEFLNIARQHPEAYKITSKWNSETGKMDETVTTIGPVNETDQERKFRLSQENLLNIQSDVNKVLNDGTYESLSTFSYGDVKVVPSLSNYVFDTYQKTDDQDNVSVISYDEVVTQWQEENPPAEEDDAPRIPTDKDIINFALRNDLAPIGDVKGGLKGDIPKGTKLTVYTLDDGRVWVKGATFTWDKDQRETMSTLLNQQLATGTPNPTQYNPMKRTSIPQMNSNLSTLLTTFTDVSFSDSDIYTNDPNKHTNDKNYHELQLLNYLTLIARDGTSAQKTQSITWMKKEYDNLPLRVQEFYTKQTK